MMQARSNSVTQGLPPLVPVKEAATFLHAHPQTIRDLCRRGELAAVQRLAKQGSRVLIIRDSIDDYVERNRL